MDWKTINRRYIYPALKAAEADDVREADRLFEEGLAASHEDGNVALRFSESLQRDDEARRLFVVAHRKLPKPGDKKKAKEGPDRLSTARTLSPVEAITGRIGLLSCTKNDVEERDVWARFIAARLHHEGIGENHSVFIHATDKYAVPLRDALDRYCIRATIIDWDSNPTEEDLDG